MDICILMGFLLLWAVQHLSTRLGVDTLVSLPLLQQAFGQMVDNYALINPAASPEFVSWFASLLTFVQFWPAQVNEFPPPTGAIPTDVVLPNGYVLPATSQVSTSSYRSTNYTSYPWRGPTKDERAEAAKRSKYCSLHTKK